MRNYPTWTRARNWISVPEFITSYGQRSKPELDASPIEHVLAGRISSIRESSRKLWFVDIVQDGRRSQLILNRSHYPSDEKFSECTQSLTRGDIVEASGSVTRTLTGELSLHVRDLKVLTPCRMVLPDSELDTENQMRQRHLHMLSKPEFLEVLRTRSKIIKTIRTYLDENGFLEVETPVLATKYGGANARPFETNHMADLPLYLRIAPELALKQLVVGGAERVYELGKVFRNEGLDADHNPEFTSCEFYQSYANYEDMMGHTERLLGTIGKSLGKDIFSNRPFKRLYIVPTLEELITAKLPLEEPDTIAKEVLLKVAADRGIHAVNHRQSLPKIYDKLIGHYLEPLCVNPTFLVGHPMVLSPLSKASAGNPRIADRFELFSDGFEIANGFSEQNDPEMQLEAFQKQAMNKAAGDAEAQPLDEDFVQVLNAGLPPSGGCGLGVDRLVMLFTGKKHIRDVLAYPLVRPKQC